MQISSESVKVGHPDVVADVISAQVIGRILDQEKALGLTVATMPHCGLEVFLGKNLCLIGGEVRARVKIDVEACVREAVLSLGYNDEAVGLDGRTMRVINE
ncbi:MAG TPA: S-adenosylmethionine synthetase N-terminal domain-containing protein, partial [Syntrophales bacterium]|nr:S-adenosylmethionine synthetase N-terminal domain-containing protein [Syntrophales bacterium]